VGEFRFLGPSQWIGFFFIVYHFVEWFSTDTDQISVFKFRFEIGLSHF